MKMTFQKLTKEIADRFDLSQEGAMKVLHYTFGVIASEVSNGGKVVIPRFGTFKRTVWKAKQVKNFEDQYVQVPEAFSAHFSQSKALKRVLNLKTSLAKAG